MSGGSSIAADTTMSGLTTDTTRTTSAGRGRGGGRGRGRGGGRGNAGSGTSRPRSTGFGSSPVHHGGRGTPGSREENDEAPEDLASLFAAECRMPVLVRPPKPVAAPTAQAGDSDTAAADTEDIEAEIEIWKEDLRALSKRKSVLRGNLSAIHAVIWGQCSEAMKAKLKSLDDYTANAEEDNCEWFIRTINATSQ
jgi:hypothetical protein